MNIVQVGVNTSQDDCYRFIQSNRDIIDNIYLIEPLPSCIPVIETAFKDYDNVKIFNIAICADDSRNSLQLYYPKNHHRSAHASLNYNHVAGHNHAQVDSIDVECMTLDSFFSRNNIDSCDRLYIDTEGLDCTILLNFEYYKYNIKYIEFERVHADGVFKQGDIYNKCIDRFIQNGYTVTTLNNLNSIATK